MKIDIRKNIEITIPNIGVYVSLDAAREAIEYQVEYHKNKVWEFEDYLDQLEIFEEG